MKITSLTFSFQLHAGDIRGFRAAIVEVIGLGHHLFHGHDNSEQGKTKYSNQYPLIRFAVQRGRPQIIGMGAGADAIRRHLIPLLPDQLMIQGKSYDCLEYELTNKEWIPELRETTETFGLYRWIALNKPNYEIWKTYEGEEVARQALLCSAVTGHLRALAENAAPELDRNQIVGKVVRVDKVKKVSWHGTQLIAFDALVSSNFVPYWGLGLGRCHSFGFGEACSQAYYERMRRVHGGKKSAAANVQEGLELALIG